MRTVYLARLAAGFVLLSLILAACGPTATPGAASTEAPAAAAPVTISIWHGYTGIEEQLLAQTVTDFDGCQSQHHC